MADETQQIQDVEATATVNPASIPTSESVVAAANETDKTIVDDSGNRVGQSWDHDGFAVVGTLIDGSLQYVATESDDSQRAHVRQFRYTQTFADLGAATRAIDSAQDKHDLRDASMVAPPKRSTGYTDAQMSAGGWQRITRA